MASYCLHDTPLSSSGSSLLLNNDGQFLAMTRTTITLYVRVIELPETCLS